MVSRFGKRFRSKAALALAALYAFCILAPHVAFAFADAAAAAHCLNEGPAHVHHHGVASKHQHADSSTHEHGNGNAPHDDADGKTSLTSCCGLFCINGLADAMPPLLSVSPLSSALEPSAGQGLKSRGPDRINRPPIA
jgi:hypothetical protein